ncbi:MAG TPA: hypothetical protein VNQ76_20670 [Planctomicrobium sp.]|nr:hypothetical protein [Planctomicrobium sp.]
MNAFHSLQILGQALWECCRGWWNADRVRISPQEGQLWRLQPGSRLMIEEKEVTVLSRRLIETDPTGLEFTCGSADTVGLLQVISVTRFPYLRLFWQTTEGCRELAVSDIHVWDLSEPPR